MGLIFFNKWKSRCLIGGFLLSFLGGSPGLYQYPREAWLSWFGFQDLHAATAPQSKWEMLETRASLIYQHDKENVHELSKQKIIALSFAMAFRNSEGAEQIIRELEASIRRLHSL